MATTIDIQADLEALDASYTFAHYGPDFVDWRSHSEDAVFHWARHLRHNLNTLYSGLEEPSSACYDAPRRKSRDLGEAEAAARIAHLLYPNSSDNPLSALIKYEKEINKMKACKRETELLRERERRTEQPLTIKDKILAQGPWNEVEDPLSLKGAEALPMPVVVSEKEALWPFFGYLQGVGGFGEGMEGWVQEEPFYGVKMREWQKGILYQDGRMDLCKMVVGPPHIGKLMRSLEQNNFVRQFLLGNNIIGPTGAKEVTSYMPRHPDQMETWYLAGNCIDSSSLKLLVDGWVTSSTLSNIWLKRNPLGPSSVSALFKLITNASGLRTLDLDQTELSDAGVGELFNLLAVNDLSSVRLQHIYLNANGISTAACQALAKYLATENCSLQSLYLSNNPVGDKGATALAEGLQHNTSILRLSVRSSGLKSPGAIAIMEALASHPKLMTLDLGYNFATEDLDSRYNCLDDSIKDAACKLIQTSETLQYLDLGITFMTTHARTEIADVVCDSSSLLTFKADTVFEKLPRPLKRVIRARLTENLKKVYGDEMTYEEFERGEQRWLISPKDVRLIDSAYRNRDAELA